MYRLEWHPVGMGLIHTDPITGEEVFTECGYRSEVPNSGERPENGETMTVLIDNYKLNEEV
jgi:hypothetical protein